MKNEYQTKFHILIIGDEKVGKTAIIERYFNNEFREIRKQTIGVDYYDKIKKYENKPYLFKIWDTAGQEKFSSLTKNFYQRADGIILVCSIDCKQTFINLKKWYKSINEVINEQNIQLLMIANKSDLETNREVNSTELSEFAKNLCINYFQTSAKEGTNVSLALDSIIDMVYKQGCRDFEAMDLGHCTSRIGCCN